VVFGFQEAGSLGWGDPLVTGSLCLGALVFVAFVVQQRRVTFPVIEAAIARSVRFRPPVTVAFLANWGFGALNILLTFWLQDVRDFSAATTGLVFLAYSVPFAILGALTGRIVRRAGTTGPLVLGMVLITGSFLVLTQLGQTSPMWVVLVAMLLSGVGQGLSYNVSTTAAMAAIPDADAGVASGLLTALRNVGVAAGVAVATLATATDGPANPTDSSFSAGMEQAAWVIVGVSALGTLVAWASARTDRRSAGPDTVTDAAGTPRMGTRSSSS
ncbi:MAG: MFS transporter, partial [Microthrixaceae bacterium]